MKDFKKTWARADRFWNGVFFFAVILSLLLACVRCTDEYYLGKTKEELMKEIFQVDSLIKTIQLEIDSTSMDFEKMYINARKIDTGHD